MGLEDIRYEQITIGNPRNIPVRLSNEESYEKITLGDLEEGIQYYLYLKNKENNRFTSFGAYEKKEIPNELRRVYLNDKDQIESSNMEIYLIKIEDSKETQ